MSSEPNHLLNDKFELLDIEAKQQLDICIFENKKILWMITFRSLVDCSLPDALEFLNQRYDYLRKTYAEKFTQSHKEYWQGFYS